MIGLVGAQRTGKTTLARAFAQAQGIPFVATSASEVMRRLDLDPKVDYPLEVRLVAQETILAAFKIQYQQARATSSLFIADRTPIDLAAYMLADVQRSTLASQPQLVERVGKYLESCMLACSEFFSVIVLVQPGIKTAEEEGKAPACPIHMEHINSLAMGLLFDDRMLSQRYMVPRAITDLEQRVKALRNATSSVIESDKAIKQSRVYH